jgi:hypothetical protein
LGFKQTKKNKFKKIPQDAIFSPNLVELIINWKQNITYLNPLLFFFLWPLLHQVLNSESKSLGPGSKFQSQSPVELNFSNPSVPPSTARTVSLCKCFADHRLVFSKASLGLVE